MDNYHEEINILKVVRGENRKQFLHILDNDDPYNDETGISNKKGLN